MALCILSASSFMSRYSSIVLADWSVAKEQDAIKTLRCVGDVIPDASDVRLATFLKFLQLPGA